MKLSVIVCIHNGEATLGACLDSLVAVPVPEGLALEVLLLDDGSTDRSAEICRSAAARFPGVFRFFTRENRGVGATRTEGLERATGDWVIYLDCDDAFLPGFFTEALPLLLREKPDVLFFDSCYVTEGEEPRPYPALDRAGGRVTPREGMLSMPGPWNKLVRTSLYRENALFFPEGLWYEDLATCPALFRFADPEKLLYLKSTVHAYRQTPVSITRGEDWRDRYLDILPALDLLAKRLGEAYRAEAEFLVWDHLWRGFAWRFLKAGRFDALARLRRFTGKYFPHCFGCRYVRARPFRERLSARLLCNPVGARLLALREKKRS